MNLRPVGDRVLAKRKESIKESKGGILLPSESQEKLLEATVVAVGEGHLLDSGEIIPLEIKVGDKILFSKHGGTEININGEEYIIFSVKEILAIT